MNKLIISALVIASSIIVILYTPNTEKIIVSGHSKDDSNLRFDQPDKAAQWLAQLRQSPKNTNPAQLNKKIKFEVDQKELSRKNNKATGDTSIPKFRFENLGPSNFGGRIRALIIDPNDSNRLLAGAVSGGIFRSNNAGQSWEATSDFLPTLAIGSMVLDPDNNNRVFAGTGEGFFNFDAARGAGIFVSEDFGESWNQLASTDNEDFYYVNRMVRIENSDVLLVATHSGIFRSDDLGQNWNEVSKYDTKGRGFVDLKLNPSNHNHLLASHFGFSNKILNLKINSPATISGDYLAIPADFGPEFSQTAISNELALVNDNVQPNNDGCSEITNNISGKVALIQRGACRFDLKVKNAQDAGAIAVIVYQSLPDDPFSMGGEDDGITIPSAMISLENGTAIAAENGVINASIQEIISEVLNTFLMQSSDAGLNWQILDSNNGLPELNVGRMEIGFGTDGVNYIAIANEDDSTRGLWRSAGLGDNYNKTQSNQNFIERQGWYDLAVAVHPGDSNTVFIGAIDQYKTTNAGATINQNSTWKFDSLTPIDINHISNYMHSDHHGYIFDPNDNTIQYIIQDAGIYKSLDNGDTFFSVNDGLSISQSYGIAVSPDGQQVISGTQDTGSQLYFGDSNAWLQWQGGDGGYSAWDQQNSSFIYGSNPGTNEDADFVLFGSSNEGKSISHFSLPDSDGALFIEPFALDPNNGNRLIIGTDNVFLTTNARSLNNATFIDITDTLNSGSVSALTFNQEISSQILVGMTSGNLYKIENIGSQNNLVDISPNGIGYITDIKIDSNDPSGNTIYIVRATYDSNRVLKSTNGGSSWTSLSGDLPDMPLYQITIDPIDPNRLYVGSELGLWTTYLDGGIIEWSRYHYGVAFNRVVDLEWHESDTLYVATHGRGTYRATRNALEISFRNFITKNGNIDNDGVIEDDGIIDAGENGTLMINIQNSSGFAISDAQISLIADDLMPNKTVNLSTIPADSSISIPLDISLGTGVSCLSTVDISTEIHYDNLSFSNEFNLLTASDIITSTSNFIANAEEADTQMDTTTLLGNSPWRRDSNSASSGTSSWFTSNENSYSDKSLISPWLVMNSGGNVLDFSLKYSTEGSPSQHWDGAVLEIREKGGLWSDIGHLSSIPYDGQISTNNTAQTRFTWSGSQNNWRDASVNLAETYKGKTIQFRFRMISDTNTAAIGFWVDDISLSNVIRKEQARCDEKVGLTGKIPANGYWYDQAKDGHGFVIEPVGFGNLYFSGFYTYDDLGNPEWYSSVTELKNGVLNIDFDADTLKKFIYDYDTNQNLPDPELTDGRLSIDFNSTTAASHNACQDDINRQDEFIAIAKWKINDQQGEWCIEPIIAEKSKQYTDISGNWYAGEQDSGWGLSLATAQSSIVSTLYYYDESGQPRWALGLQNDFKRGEEITIQMREFSGYSRLETPIGVTSTSIGSITANINNALGIIDIDATTSIDIEYQGVEGGQWIRNNIPMQILTKPN